MKKYTSLSILVAGIKAAAEPATKVDAAADTLRSAGYDVERCEFPPPPLPGLWQVNERELTEAQMVYLAREIASA